MSQRIDDRFFTFSGREFQNPDVHFVGNVFGMGVPQHVVGHAKLAGREHFFAVLVVGKRAGLANQRIDDVTIIDRHQFLADKSRHGLNDVPLMRHDDFFGCDSQINLLTDQPTGNRIRICPHVNRAAFADANLRDDIVRVEPFERQRFQLSLLFCEPCRAVPVGAGHDSFDEADVLGAAGKVTTSAKQQRLIDAVFDVPIQRFHIAVLVGASRVGAFSFAAVVI